MGQGEMGKDKSGAEVIASESDFRRRGGGSSDWRKK